MLLILSERVEGSVPWIRAISAFWSSVRALRSCQSSGTAKVMPTVGAVIAWWPAGTEGVALAPPEALGCEVVLELLDAVAATVAAEVVAPAGPADEGSPWEQAARMRTVAKAVVTVEAVRVGVMVSPG